jgi:hypothetical protein
MLQDEILDTTTDGDDPGKVNNLQLINQLDYGINFFLLIVTSLLGLIAIFEISTLFLLALCNFVLGVYQLISAIVGSLRGNELKRNYLIMAITYLILLWLAGAIFDSLLAGDFAPALLIIFVLILPLVGATYFTYLCFNAKK